MALAGVTDHYREEPGVLVQDGEGGADLEPGESMEYLLVRPI